jgi:hypothetical protein
MRFHKERERGNENSFVPGKIFLRSNEKNFLQRHTCICTSSVRIKRVGSPREGRSLGGRQGKMAHALLLRENTATLKKKLGRKEVTAKDSQGQTLLHVCCTMEEPPLDTVRLILSKKADANARDNDGWTPLHCACSASANLALLKVLGAPCPLDQLGPTIPPPTSSLGGEGFLPFLELQLASQPLFFYSENSFPRCQTFISLRPQNCSCSPVLCFRSGGGGGHQADQQGRDERAALPRAPLLPEEGVPGGPGLPARVRRIHQHAEQARRDAPPQRHLAG